MSTCTYGSVSKRVTESAGFEMGQEGELAQSRVPDNFKQAKCACEGSSASRHSSGVPRKSESDR
jgi:hypothetical protein